MPKIRCYHRASEASYQVCSIENRDIYTYIYQGLIQDFLLGGGNHIFEFFLDILDSRTDEFSYNNFSNST